MRQRKFQLKGLSKNWLKNVPSWLFG